MPSRAAAQVNAGTVLSVSDLASRLGFATDARVVIVTCDDLGSSHSANLAIDEALGEGWATSAGLMVPAPWSRAAAARHGDDDIGIHLTLNAELDLFRWGPVTQAPSLLGGDGGFPSTVEDLWDHADLDEVRRECRAQIERAIDWGFDLTHLDSHLGALSLRPEFFDIALELAIEFTLPVRLPDAAHEATTGFPFRRLAAEEGVLSPDQTVSPGVGPPSALPDLLADLSPGVTELMFRPAADTPELRALTTDWLSRSAQAEALRKGSPAEAVVIASGAKLIGYRALRDLQRSVA